MRRCMLCAYRCKCICVYMFNAALARMKGCFVVFERFFEMVLTAVENDGSKWKRVLLNDNYIFHWQ